MNLLEAIKLHSVDEHRRVVVGLVGEVSAGKSTFLNAIFASALSGTQMRRTTMAPTVYLEEERGGGGMKAMPQNDVLAMVQQRDSAMYERGGDVISVSETAMAFVVPPLKDIGKRGDCEYDCDVKYAFVDVPGDSTTDSKIHKWLGANLPAMDAVVFVIDGTSAMNTKSEKEALQLVVEGIAEASQYKDIALLVVFNKMDDPLDDEMRGM